MKPLNEQPLTSGKVPKNKMAIFSYLGPLFWVPVFISRDDENLKFHIRQGLILFFFEILVGSLTFSSPHLWLLIVTYLLILMCVILSIIGILNVMRGRQDGLPLIGRLAKRIKFPHMRAQKDATIS